MYGFVSPWVDFILQAIVIFKIPTTNEQFERHVALQKYKRSTCTSAIENGLLILFLQYWILLYYLVNAL